MTALREGWRSAWGRRVHWERVRAGPVALAGLLLASVLLGVLVQRSMVKGEAQFWWQALGQGWWQSLLILWLCWVVARRQPPEPARPDTARLFGLLLAQGLAIGLVWGLATVAAADAGAWAGATVAAWGAWGVWWGGWAWWLAAAVLVFWRAAAGQAALRGLAVAVIAGNGLLVLYVPQSPYWYATGGAGEVQGEAQRPPLTQQIAEAQPALLEAQLQALAAQRAGVVDLYAITYAPYADEDVFRRESAMVASVVTDRFDAAGRTLQLVNSAQTMQQLPWATPLNLERAVQAVAARMDREEDVLLLHLTSHGAQDGRLAPGDWPPLALDALTPMHLRGLLDAAGVRWRVVSVSACYSGSWIGPLANPETLVMSASDAEHTSYGCGRRSELTFFGRAVYDEQLRLHTRSFERAHAAARPLIEQRERDAGKDDGYSNPQIAAGDAIRARLRRLEARLDGAPAPYNPPP